MVKGRSIGWMQRRSRRSLHEAAFRRQLDEIYEGVDIDEEAEAEGLAKGEVIASDDEGELIAL